MSRAADDIDELQDRVKSGISRLRGLELGDEMAVEILANLIEGIEPSWIVTCTDGGYILAGEPGMDGGSNARVVRIDASGNVLWERDYGGPGWDSAWSGAVVDGIYRIVGETSSGGEGELDI